ncbi:DUF4267 domain-containing protein [Methylobacterium sp. J-067]|uniref:DUF4267 domain-containing protein n=1 Tax=Methylobacterium sp. J-067 TaxID=2836648 RepID=UPI001FB9CBB0|nr:DUF4267 domain-containing protein [Methylobacterium sp. J-067]MCJ2024498.1 DUF4267 domain-containing protein [Methylobacterium sp. J-067]
MYWFSMVIALLAAFGIIAIGMMYLSDPKAATRSFGLPLPEAGANVAWWLRLKGVRDVVSGIVVLAMLVWGGPRVLGIILLVEALIPAGDMSLVVAARGSTARALGIHGLTAMLMITGAVPLILGAA